ncbi:MAG: hypothetical protein HKN21_07280, partial [Candidatus Eisenbacteria bacterium]|nr:hypothetical protein [Candidatus Eisenbacteria bacterium]
EKEPTPLSDHTQLAPSSLDRLVRRCLEKDPDARLQNARDAMHELKWIAANPTEVSAQSQEPETSKKRTGLKVWQVAMAVALVALLAERFLLPQLFPPKAVDSPIQPMVRAMIDLPEGHRLAGWASPTVAISDDGSTIAFVTQSESVPANQLWVRDLGASESKLVPESISAEGPTFSPDGKWVLFAVGVSGTKPQGVTRGLKKYSLETGLTQEVCDTRDFFGASWGKDGTIIYADQLPKGLWQVNAAGGTGNNFLKAAKVQEKSYSSLAWPQLLDVPNKSLVRLQGGSAFLRLGILNLESGAFSDLNIRATATAPISKNRLAYVDPKGTLLVAPLNTATESVSQSGIAVDRDISIAGAGAAVFAVAKNGTAIFSRGAVRGNRRNLRQLKIVKDKASITLPLEPNYFTGMAASPDGEFFATVLDGKIRVTELKGLTETVLPLGKVEGPMALRWSPDGKWLAFRGMDGGTTLDVFVIAVDGSSEPRRIFKAPSEAAPRSWFQSSRELLVHDFALDGKRLRLFRVPFDGEPTEVNIEPLADARLSPDGSVLLYLERQGTRPALVMRSFPDLGPKVRVLPGDDWRAVWSRDGSKVFAFGSEEAVEVDITREPFLAASQPRSILTNPGSYVWPHLSADGFGGFYVMEDVPGSGIVTQLEIITNWADNMPTFD